MTNDIGDAIWQDSWRYILKTFLAKRFVDISAGIAFAYFFGSQYSDFKNDAATIAAILIGASVAIYIRDALAFWFLSATNEPRVASRSLLVSLRQSPITPDELRRRNFAGLQELAEDRFASADSRVFAGTAFAAATVGLNRLPWFRREYGREMLDEAVFRFVSEQQTDNPQRPDTQSL